MYPLHQCRIPRMQLYITYLIIMPTPQFRISQHTQTATQHKRIRTGSQPPPQADYSKTSTSHTACRCPDFPRGWHPRHTAHHAQLRNTPMVPAGIHHPSGAGRETGFQRGRPSRGRPRAAVLPGKLPSPVPHMS